MGRFEAFLNDPVHFEHVRALKHGDLGPGKILLDLEIGAISGIVDLGSAGLDDPAIDLGFVSLWAASLLGRSFVERLDVSYPVTGWLLNRPSQAAGMDREGKDANLRQAPIGQVLRPAGAIAGRPP